MAKLGEAVAELFELHLCLFDVLELLEERFIEPDDFSASRFNLFAEIGHAFIRLANLFFHARIFSSELIIEGSELLVGSAVSLAGGGKRHRCTDGHEAGGH